MTRAEIEVGILKNNVKELQENIQTQYIRVAELLKEIKELEEIIRRVSKQPEMAEKQ